MLNADVSVSKSVFLPWFWQPDIGLKVWKLIQSQLYSLANWSEKKAITVVRKQNLVFLLTGVSENIAISFKKWNSCSVESMYRGSST